MKKNIARTQIQEQTEWSVKQFYVNQQALIKHWAMWYKQS